MYVKWAYRLRIHVGFSYFTKYESNCNICKPKTLIGINAYYDPIYCIKTRVKGASAYLSWFLYIIAHLLVRKRRSFTQHLIYRIEQIQK